MSSDTIDAQQRFDVIDVYNNYALGIDTKNWPLVRSCFTDEVLIDYGEISAATGSADVPRKAEDWLAHIKGVINGFDQTRHAITNHRFHKDGDAIVCAACLRADHIIFSNPEHGIAGTDDIVTIVGKYTNTCLLTEDGWKVSKSRLEVNWSSGNAALFPQAMQRAATA